MIKISKNYIYLAVIIIFSFFLFRQSDITLFRPVYVRVKELELFSVEFWVLVIFSVFIAASFIRYKGYLFEKFIIGFFASLILTDSVYKFASVQISDIFGFLAVFTYCFRSILTGKGIKINIDFIKKPPGKLMLITFLICFISLLSPGCAYLYEKIGNGSNILSNITSWLYLVRIVILFLLCNILYNASLANKGLVKNCLKILLYSGILGCLVYWTQIGLSVFNTYDVNGIFNDFGFPRAKGLAHEPATFAHSLFFIIILSLINERKMNLKIFVLILTMIATFSLGMYITAGLCLIIYCLNKFINTPKKVKSIVIAILFSGILLAFLYHAGDISFKIGYKFIYHIQNKLFEQNPLIDILFQQYPSVKLFGVGLLNSVQFFADSFEVRNSYSLIYQDTGMIGFLLFVFLLFYNLFICFKNSKSDGKFLLFSYIFSFCLITLSVIRLTFFPYLWLGLTLFYDKSLFDIKEDFFKSI